MITRQQIIDTARSYIGVPYAQQGRSREIGLDCVGLLIKIAHDTGYSDFDFLAYGSNPDGETMERLLGEQLDRLEFIDQAQEGDVISMDFGGGEQHVGVLSKMSPKGIKYSYMIHALRDHGVVEGRPFGKYLRSIRGAYRLKGIVDVQG